MFKIVINEKITYELLEFEPAFSSALFLHPSENPNHELKNQIDHPVLQDPHGHH